MFVPLTATSSLTALGEVLTAVWGWFAGFLSVLSTEPILLIGLAFIVAALVIGLVFSAVRGRGKSKK